MEDAKVLILITKVAKVLQGNYRTQDACKKDISALLEEIDKIALEISGKIIIKRETVVEALANGLYGGNKTTTTQP